MIETQQTKLDIAIDYVLEPLCEATDQVLKKLDFASSDYLHIKLDLEAKWFIVQVQSYQPATAYTPDNDIVELNGERMIKTDKPSWVAQQWIQRIPEHKSIGYCRWQMATTDFTALVIYHLWTKDHIIFKDEDAKLTFEFLVKRFFWQANSAKIAADFKTNGIVPKMPKDYIPHPDPLCRLSSYQDVALLTVLDQSASALLMDAGTGKTPIIVNRINLEGKRKYDRTGQMYKCLVLCPKNVRINWEHELGKFSVQPGRVSVLRGGELRRTKAMLDGIRSDPEDVWSCCIISTDSCAGTWEAIRRVSWDLVVIDESHSIKNPQSRRFKTVKLFHEIKCAARCILTGTFIANTIFDAYSQLEFLGEGLSGFSSFAAFRGFHGKFKTLTGRGLTPIQKLIGIKALPLFQERLSRIAFMINKEEANLQLPDKLYDMWEVEMSAIQKEYYNKLASQLVLEIEDMLSDTTRTVSADHILTKLLRLAQITSGFIKIDGDVDPHTGDKTLGYCEQIAGENPKISAVIDMLEDEQRDTNGKTVVWCCFKEDIRALSVALHEAGIMHVGYHTEILKDYRAADVHFAVETMNTNDMVRVFIGNPGSAREGLNILGYNPDKPDESEMAVDHVIYYSCNWSYIHRSQSEDRAHRRGTRRSVRITDLMVEGTIDEEIRARVLGKKQTSMLITDVREILAGLVKV